MLITALALGTLIVGPALAHAVMALATLFVVPTLIGSAKAAPPVGAVGARLSGAQRSAAWWSRKIRKALAELRSSIRTEPAYPGMASRKSVSLSRCGRPLGRPHSPRGRLVLAAGKHTNIKVQA